MRLIWICLPVALGYPAMAPSWLAAARQALRNNREILPAQKRNEAAGQHRAPAAPGVNGQVFALARRVCALGADKFHDRGGSRVELP